jgi:hypothetical protein
MVIFTFKRTSNRINFKIKIKILGSECQTSGTYAKTAKQAIKIDNAAASLCFLNYLAFLRPAADRAVSILPLDVRRGSSYGFLWACSIIPKNVRKDNPTPAYSPESEHIFGIDRSLTPPFSRACYPIILVRSCGSRENRGHPRLDFSF